MTMTRSVTIGLLPSSGPPAQPRGRRGVVTVAIAGGGAHAFEGQWRPVSRGAQVAAVAVSVTL